MSAALVKGKEAILWLVFVRFAAKAPSAAAPSLTTNRSATARPVAGIFFPLRPSLRLDSHNFSPAILGKILRAAARGWTELRLCARAGRGEGKATRESDTRPRHHRPRPKGGKRSRNRAALARRRRWCGQAARPGDGHDHVGVRIPFPERKRPQSGQLRAQCPAAAPHPKAVVRSCCVGADTFRDISVRPGQ